MGRKEKSLESGAVSNDGRWLAFLGNDGYIILADGDSKQHIADLKMSGSVSCCSVLLVMLTFGSAGSCCSLFIRFAASVYNWWRRGGVYLGYAIAPLRRKASR